MAYLVGGHEEQIADDEFDEGVPLLRREVLEARLLCELARRVAEPRLKFREPDLHLGGGGRNRLRKQALRPQSHEDKHTTR